MALLRRRRLQRNNNNNVNNIGAPKNSSSINNNTKAEIIRTKEEEAENQKKISTIHTTATINRFGFRFRYCHNNITLIELLLAVSSIFFFILLMDSSAVEALPSSFSPNINTDGIIRNPDPRNNNNNALSAALSSKGEEYKERDISTTTATNKKDVLQIMETEVQVIINTNGDYGNENNKGNVCNWTGAKPYRWTSIDGKTPSEPPISLLPPDGYIYEGDWKIVTSKIQRDSMGWEYIWNPTNTIRQRVWLRTLVPIQQQQSNSNVLPTIKKYATTKKSLWMLLQEDWNFKGYGISIYKSLIFLKSIGIAFRLPILYNLDWWERHPGLPALGTTLTFYYPWTIICGISSSVNVDFLAWLLGRGQTILFWSISVLTYSFVRAIFYPILGIIRFLFSLQQQRQKSHNDDEGREKALRYQKISSLLPRQPKPFPKLLSNPPVYSMTIQQRIGMSITWRVSQLRGYEFRVSYWYMLLPTILSLCQSILQTWEKQQQQFSIHDKKWFFRKEYKNNKINNWLRRRTASIGIDTGRPIPIPPYCWFSVVFSLTGLTFRRSDRRNKSSSSPRPAIMTTKSTTQQTLSSSSSSSTLLRTTATIKGSNTTDALYSSVDDSDDAILASPQKIVSSAL